MYWKSKVTRLWVVASSSFQRVQYGDEESCMHWNDLNYIFWDPQGVINRQEDPTNAIFLHRKILYSICIDMRHYRAGGHPNLTCVWGKKLGGNRLDFLDEQWDISIDKQYHSSRVGYWEAFCFEIWLLPRLFTRFQTIHNHRFQIKPVTGNFCWLFSSSLLAVLSKLEFCLIFLYISTTL